MGRRIASESKQTVRGGPKPAKVGLHRRLLVAQRFRRALAKRGFRVRVPQVSNSFTFKLNFFFQLLLSMILSFGPRIRS